MEFKVGEKVRIRKDLEIGKYNTSLWVDGRMVSMGGQTKVIVNKERGVSGLIKYTLEKSGYRWTSEMFEPVRIVKPVRRCRKNDT